MSEWQPGTSREALVARDKLLSVIRRFFSERGILEVQTPLLGARGASDVHLHNLDVYVNGDVLFLQTSPEYAMKRLLAAGSGPIYQLGTAFRGGETSSRHNIEFTILEWYRPGMSLLELASEVLDLIAAVGDAFKMPRSACETFSYRQLFQQHYRVNPHSLGTDELLELVRSEYPDHVHHLDNRADSATKSALLDLLFSQGIEPMLPDHLCIVTDYPAVQAALACVESVDGDPVAKRFELFWRRIELANGYDELRDSEELRDRVAENNRARTVRSLPVIAADDKLLAAMCHLPACVGVAMGVDRLLMRLLGIEEIDGVVPFVRTRL